MVGGLSIIILVSGQREERDKYWCRRYRMQFVVAVAVQTSGAASNLKRQARNQRSYH